METKKINGKAVVSLILSCLSVLCCFAWYLAIIVGMIGVVLGIIAYRESEGGQRDLAIAGIIVGGIHRKGVHGNERQTSLRGGGSIG